MFHLSFSAAVLLVVFSLQCELQGLTVNYRIKACLWNFLGNAVLKHEECSTSSDNSIFFNAVGYI
jgi:hypothetical protein